MHYISYFAAPYNVSYTFCLMTLSLISQNGQLSLLSSRTTGTDTVDHTIHIRHRISLRQAKVNMLGEALYMMAPVTFKMKMIMMVVIVLTGAAHGKIAFTILRHYLMGDTVLTKAVQYPVYGNPVRL